MTKTWLLLTALVAFAGVLPSCQKKSDDTSGATAQQGVASSDHPAVGNVTLNGSGSSFQTAFQQSAIEAFQKSHPGVKINYAGGGSGNGRQQLADMVVDFAGTDAPYHAEDLAKVKGGQILYFPLLLGPITVSYNVTGVPKLQLSPATVAKIFERDIKKWNDAAIAADNPGVKLPAIDIVVARRADGSGTTENFTKYLDAAAQGVWKLKSGATVEWPADTTAGPGNGGVAQIVKSTSGAIGYVDLSDATAAGLSFAAIQNGAGKFVAPTAAAASAAGEGIQVGDDLVFSAINAKGDAAYPITYQTWLIAYANEPDATKRAALVAYIRYLLSDGQKMLPDLDYAPLPKSLQSKALAQLDKIKG
jgi:phosphate transport system substrate-binding protein